MKYSLLILSCALLTLNAYGQEKSQETQEPGNYYWYQVYAGSTGSGVGSGISLNLNFGKLLYKASLHHYESSFLDFFGPPSQSLTGVSLQGGYMGKSGIWFYTFSGGVGYGVVNDPVKVGETGGWFSSGIYEDRFSDVLIIPIEAQAGMKILDVMTLSAIGGIQLNHKAPHAYIGIGLGFGKLF